MRRKHPKPNLLLLEIQDNDIAGFIIALRKIFNNKDSCTYPHITLRGPYKTTPSKNIIKKIEDELINNEPFIISGASIFNNENANFVYLAVTNSNMERLLWKKDYPKSKFGLNPHISIYKGDNFELATKICDFLNQQNLYMTCHLLALSLHIKGQRKLNLLSPNTIEMLIKKGGIYPSVIKDAKQLMELYNLNKSKSNQKYLKFSGN